MPLLWALSSKLSISVYIVIRGKSLQLQEAQRQALHCMAGAEGLGIYWLDLGKPFGTSFKIRTVVEGKVTSW